MRDLPSSCNSALEVLWCHDDFHGDADHLQDLHHRIDERDPRVEVSLAHITRANRNTKRLCPHFVWYSYSYIPRQSRCLGLRKGQNHPIKQFPKIKHKDPRKNLTYQPSYSLTSKQRLTFPTKPAASPPHPYYDATSHRPAPAPTTHRVDPAGCRRSGRAVVSSLRVSSCC